MHMNVCVCVCVLLDINVSITLNHLLHCAVVCTLRDQYSFLRWFQLNVIKTV